MSSKMSGNKDEECKVVGGPLGWFSSGTWGLKAEGGGSWGICLLTCGAQWQLTTMRDVFLFHLLIYPVNLSLSPV